MILYLPGLSPTLSFASLSVKPALLSLFENYIVDLDSAVLKPALKAITLALLPGLEDQTSEEFERTHDLLTRVRDAVGRSQSQDEGHYGGTSYDVAGSRYFWQSIFLTTMTSSSRRQGALHYLTRNLPRLAALPDISKSTKVPSATKVDGTELRWPTELEAVILPEPGLLIRCFAAGLRDDQLLVQRGFLDLLVTHLPLSSSVLQRQVKPEDLELLISAAASVVARREMSLNRRLWSWFIGPETSKDYGDSTPDFPDPSGNPPLAPSQPIPAKSYFEQHGLGPLTESVRKMIAADSTAASMRARPFRICLSLMDRSEIGGLVVPRIFVPAMESIWQYETIAPSKDAFADVLRSAHVFFDGIQSRLIWSELIQLTFSAFDADSLRTSSSQITDAQKKLDLVWFVITRFNVREEEMLVIHMPMACLLILACTCNIQRSTDFKSSPKINEPIATALRIASRLLDLIPERAFIDSEAVKAGATFEDYRARHSKQDINTIIGSYQHSSLESSPAFTENQTASMIVCSAAEILILALESSSSRGTLEPVLSLLAKATQKSQRYACLGVDAIISKLLPYTKSCVEEPDKTATFSTVIGLLSIFEFLNRVISPNQWTSDHRIRKIATNLLFSFWECLSPSGPHSVEAVRSFWRLHSISPAAQLVESTIASLMIGQINLIGGDNVTLEGSRRFATLWTHSSSKLQAISDRRSNSGRAKKKSGKKSLTDFGDPEMLARPLLLFLDSLSDQSTVLSMFTTSWLQSLPSIQM